VIKKTDSRSLGYNFKLIALTHLPFYKDEYSEGRIYSPTTIGNAILQFLSTHNTQKNPIAFTINGNHIAQQFCMQAASFYTQSTQDNPEQLIEYYALDCEKNDMSMHYVCAIERSMIMQYQLIAIAHTLNLQVLSTPAMAHLNLYRYVSKKVSPHFKLNKLEDALKSNNYQTRNLIDNNAIETIIQMPTFLEKTCQNYDEISTALGAIIPLISA
jgi:hypothetical protein